MYRYYRAQAFPQESHSPLTGLSPMGTGALGAEPNYEVRPRILRDYCFVYVEKGRGHLSSFGRPFELNPGDLFLLFPDCVHAYGTDPEDLLEVYWILFSGSMAGQLAGNSGYTGENAVLSVGDSEAARQVLEQMKEDSFRNTRGSYLKLCGDLYRLFGVLQSLHGDCPSDGIGAAGCDLSRTVTEAQDFMNIHYSEPLTVAEIADYVGVSRATLAEHFRRECGRTPSEYLTYLRLQQAVNLLQNTALTVSEVASSVGYSDALYFSRVFSKYYKTSPRSFRRKK